MANNKTNNSKTKRKTTKKATASGSVTREYSERSWDRKKAEYRTKKRRNPDE